MPSPAEADPGRDALVRLVRDEGARVLATLTRTTGSLELAQDAVQDAVVRALEVWPRDGVPPEPRAWLTLSARRRAIDLLRRESRRAEKEALAELQREPDAVTDETVRDDLLRLLFTCCHPSLAVETQTALALRTLCGLSTAEVARALLVPEATMAKRLTRARQKIAIAAIPYTTPRAIELPGRLDGVLTTVYLLFTEGYRATSGEDPLRRDLCAEAQRLARLLHELLPGEPGPLGLLALILLQDSRREARADARGDIVLLSAQDRSRWDTDQIHEAMVLLGTALRRTPVRPDGYVVQAAIAACHALAPRWEQTPWDAVISWYDVLLTVSDTPVVRLNRAVAVAERDGPAAGLAELEAVQGLEAHAGAQAARVELLERSGRRDEARSVCAAALGLPMNDARRRHLAEVHRRLVSG